MTALIIQKLFISFGLLLALNKAPHGFVNKGLNPVTAFSIYPHYRLQSKLYTSTIFSEKTLSNSPSPSSSPSSSQCSSDTGLCEQTPQKSLELKKRNEKSAGKKNLNLPNHKNFSATMSIPILARAALATYDPKHTFENENYRLCNYLDSNGFRAATFCNSEEKVAIIAFRGTQNRKDAAFDLALLYGQEEVMSSFAKLFSGFAYIQDSILEAMTTFGNRFAEIAIDKRSYRIKKAHKACLESLTKRWHTYRSQHLSSPGVAEKTLNERVGYVTSYTRKQIKHFENLGYEVYLTGHSLGGLYAQLASMMFGLAGATFNAPGVSDVLYHCKNFIPQTKNEAGLMNYRHNDDLVSLFKLDDHFGTVIAHEFPKKNPYTAHNMEVLFQLLNDVKFDENGENDYKDLVAFIEDEQDTL